LLFESNIAKSSASYPSTLSAFKLTSFTEIVIVFEPESEVIVILSPCYILSVSVFDVDYIL